MFLQAKTAGCCRTIDPASAPNVLNIDTRYTTLYRWDVRLSIEPTSEVPIYHQLATQLRFAIAGGELIPGERLPSNRELAKTLVIAPLTVKKAYDELERTGYLEYKNGIGTFVVEKPPAMEGLDVENSVRPFVRELLVRSALLGLTTSQLVQFIAAEADRLRSEQRAPVTRSGSECEGS